MMFAVWSVMKTGAQYGVSWNLPTIRNWGIYTIWLLLIVYGPRWNLGVWFQILGSLFGWTKFGPWLELYVAKWFQFSAFLLIPFCTWLFVSGFWMWIRTTRFQKGIDNLGLKSATGTMPKVVRVVNLEAHQKRVLVYAAGFDIEAFRSKKGILETSFGLIVQDIKISASNRQIVEILMSEKELPTLVKFEDHSARLIRPYSFLVGQSMDEFIVGDLCDLHHMLLISSYLSDYVP